MQNRTFFRINRDSFKGKIGFCIAFKGTLDYFTGRKKEIKFYLDFLKPTLYPKRRPCQDDASGTAHSNRASFGEIDEAMKFLGNPEGGSPPVWMITGSDGGDSPTVFTATTLICIK